MIASIVITNFNYSKYISRCIRSCLNQNFDKANYEIIIVDDCSTDDSLKVINSFKDENNISIVKNKSNLGVAGSANKGILKSKGKYVVRVDADDFVSNQFLNFLVFYMEDNKNAFCVSCDYTLVDNNENKIKRITYQNEPVSCGVMYRKDLLIELGMYNKKFKHREEEELRARLGSLYKIHNLNISLYRYRKHGTNKTTQTDMMTLFKKKLDNEYKVRKKNFSTKNLLDYVVVIIPARGGSKRLKNKNILKIGKKPMIHWAIEAAKKSKYVNDIFVSTENLEIKKIASSKKVKIIDRPEFLSDDQTYKMNVIVHALNEIKKLKKPSIVVSLQANSPEVESEDIDKSIDHLIKYKRSEVISVDSHLNQNGAIRTMIYDTVYEKNLSTHLGSIKSNITDIHDSKDFEKAKKNKKFL